MIFIVVALAGCGKKIMKDEEITFWLQQVEDSPRLQWNLLPLNEISARTTFSLTEKPYSIDADIRFRASTAFKAEANGRKIVRDFYFKKNGDNWILTQEQDCYDGPNRYNTPDGDVHERISMAYSIGNDNLLGENPNKLYIQYTTEFDFRQNLNLNDIIGILTKWDML